MEIKGLKLRPYPHQNKTAKFDMQLICVENGETLNCTLEYCTKIFKEESVKDFIKYFKTIASSVIDDPEKKLSEIQVAPEEEIKELESQLSDDLENE
jgi:hypothetical protein